MSQFSMAPSGPAGRDRGRRDALLATAVYAVLAVAATWPLARDPGRVSVPSSDTLANTWTLSWIAHQALRDPLHLFDANAYYPEPQSLAYGESLLAESLMAAPLRWLGASPVLAYNLPLLLTFPLAGLGVFLLARDLGASRGGAFLGGLAYAFNAYRWDHIVHIQSLSAQWFPFALLALRRTLGSGSRSGLAALFAFCVLQALSSGYYAVLLGPALLVPLAFEGRAALRRGTLLPTLVTLALAAGLVVTALWPHRELQARQGFTRARDQSIHWSARPASYLEPGPFGGLPHQRALHEALQDREPLGSGLVVLGLAVAGLLGVRRSPGALLAATLAGVGVALSLGPELRLGTLTLTGPLELLRTLPGMSGLRTPSRFGVLALLGISLLAALGYARCVAVWGARGRRFAGGLLLFVACLEGWPVGLDRLIRPMPAAPPGVEWLGRAPRAPVIELPWHEHGDSATYLFWSIGHWQPMVNGYAAFEPTQNRTLGLIGDRWPTPYAAQRFRDFGIRYVLLHTDRLRPPQLARLRSRQELPEGVRLVEVVGHDWIYEIDGSPADSPAKLPRP